MANASHPVIVPAVFRNVEPIISPKEARKLLGFNAKGLSDAKITGIVRAMQKLAVSLVDEQLVPQNGKAMVK